MTSSRDIEHVASQGKGLARESSVAKRSSAPCPAHSGMVNRTSDTIGAAPTGRPTDAVDPSLYSTQQAGKTFDIPKASWDMKDADGRGVDDIAAHKVMAQATTSPDDFAAHLNTRLPERGNRGDVTWQNSERRSNTKSTIISSRRAITWPHSIRTTSFASFPGATPSARETL